MILSEIVPERVKVLPGCTTDHQNHLRNRMPSGEDPTGEDGCQTAPKVGAVIVADSPFNKPGNKFHCEPPCSMPESDAPGILAEAHTFSADQFAAISRVQKSTELLNAAVLRSGFATA